MNVTIGNDPLVNWESFQQARSELGANFVRILGYFREDGIKSVDRIEDAMRSHNATAMVIPAHTLKGESRQFGADPLADLAETFEFLLEHAIRKAVRLRVLVAGLHPREDRVVTRQVADHVVIDAARVREVRPFPHEAGVRIRRYRIAVLGQLVELRAPPPELAS